MERTLLILLGLGFLMFTHSVAAAEDAQKPKAEAPKINLGNEGQSLFDMFGYGSDVYLGQVVKRELAPPYGFYEDGNLTLSIDEVLRGTTRESVILPYHIEVGGDFKADPRIWQPLIILGGRTVLCVVVPNAYDPNGGRGLQSGLNEAACLVAVIDREGQTVRESFVGATYDPRDKDVLGGMKTILKLYDLQDRAELTEGLKKALADPQPMVRDFAYQAAAIKLGQLAPEEALALLRAQAAQATDGDEGIMRLVEYLQHRGNASPLAPEARQWVARCLVAVAQSEAKTQRRAALAALVNQVRNTKNNNLFKLREGLKESDVRALRPILEKEAPNGNVEYIQRIKELKDWLGE